MIVNASRVIRYLTAHGSPDPWGEYDRASTTELCAWADAARAWEADR